MRKIVRVFTLFSGYESQLMALMLLSMKHPKYKFELVGWCEIDDAAIRSHNSVFPEYTHVHYKDVTKIDWSKVPEFDLLFYSSCCQSLSLTGAMEGMEKGSGTQSSLIWYVLDAIKAQKPKYCILENVKNIVSKTFLPSFIDWMRAVDDEGYHSAAKILNSLISAYLRIESVSSWCLSEMISNKTIYSPSLSRWPRVLKTFLRTL